jgi:undecaprenyl diphosphate synthase
MAEIQERPLPVHVAVIMDGNGRWAAARGLSRVDGHKAGIEAVRRIVRVAGDLGIGYLTLYTFASENWNRPPGEVMGLMKLLAETTQSEVPELNRNNVRLRTIGDIKKLPGPSRHVLDRAMTATASNTGLSLILALNYGGRDEILRAVKTIAGRVAADTLNPNDIGADVFAEALDTAGIPDPDLLIRTSGEYRLSNFLLWQLAYTELFITGILWPDFGEDDFLDALESYAGRERRYGMTSQQLAGIPRTVAAIFKGRNR